MKPYSTFLFLFLLLFFLNACDEDDEQPDSPNYGIEYFECKINGEPFQAVSDFTCSGPRFDYYPEAYLNSPEGYTLFRGRDCQTDISVAIRMNCLEHQTGVLNFIQPNFADTIYPYYGYFSDTSGELVLLENLVEGEMNIEEFIPRETGSSPLGTIKGTFEFIVTNELGIDTIHITEGRFRFDVPQIF